MRCIDLIEEKDGNVLIAGCRINEDANIAKIKLSQLSSRVNDTETTIACHMDVTTMKYNHPHLSIRYCLTPKRYGESRK